MFWVAILAVFVVLCAIAWVVWLVVDWALDMNAKVKLMWEQQPRLVTRVQHALLEIQRGKYDL